MKLPRVLLGYVKGPLRWEAQKEKELFETRVSNWIVNRGPVVIGNSGYCLTHLQKESEFGFLLFWPFILHVWYMPIPQEQTEDGVYMPGTEFGVYARTPGWRFDFADWKYILSKGYFGLHWD